jgi:hypothetical protein
MNEWEEQERDSKFNPNSNISSILFCYSEFTLPPNLLPLFQNRDWVEGLLQLQQTNDFVVKIFLHRLIPYTANLANGHELFLK